MSTIKSRCRTIFLESENEIKFDFSTLDFEKFLDGTYLNLDIEKNLVEKLQEVTQDLKDINETESERIKRYQIFLNTINEFVSNFDETRNITPNSVLIESLTYLGSSLITQENLDQDYYDFILKLETAMQEISSGMRPQIVLSNLTINSGSNE